MDFEKKVIKKKNKCMAKRKERFAKLYALIESFLSFCPRSFIILLSCYIPALIFCPKSPAVLMSCYVLTLIFCSKSPVVLWFCYMPALVSYPKSPVVLLFCYILALAASSALFLPCYAFISYCRISALLLLLFMLNPLLILGFSPLRTLK